MVKFSTETKQNKGYYDVDLKTDTTCEWFYLQDLRQRKLFLYDDIETNTVEDVVKHVLQFNKEDKDIAPENRTPILLYITSNGGDVDSGFEVIDVILNSKTPVYTINLGYWYSMGFLIGIAGHKRYATKHAKFLMHDGSHFIYNSGAKAQDQMEFQKRIEGRIKEYVLSRSNVTNEEYDSKLRIEWYLFADEAKDKGFIDLIIGEDCDIDEVI